MVQLRQGMAELRQGVHRLQQAQVPTAGHLLLEARSVPQLSGDRDLLSEQLSVAEALVYHQARPLPSATPSSPPESTAPSRG
jgi:hypothetical protein